MSDHQWWTVAIHPTKIERQGDERLRIEWSDETSREYDIRQLRDHCPCATCREKRSAPPKPTMELPILSAAEAQPPRLLGMKPVGRYAYSLSFSDGHNTGIYTFELLLSLGASGAPASG